MDVLKEVALVLDEVMGLAGRSSAFTRDTLLFGALPEFDSMAVVAILEALEERFGFVVADDEIDADAFASVGSLVDFVDRKLAVA